MAVTFSNFTNGSVTAGGGDKGFALSFAPTIGHLPVFAIVSQGAQRGSPLGATDNSPDGLGTYSTVVDVLDSATTSQLTVVVRDRAFQSTTNPTVTTVGIPAGAGSGGWHGWAALGLAREGTAAVRQSASAPSMAASSTPVTNFSEATESGNPLVGYIFQDGTGGIGAPSSGGGSWSLTIAGSITTPATYVRGYASAAPTVPLSSVTLGTTPSSTYCLAWVELALVIDPIFKPGFDYSGFPKPVLAGLV